MYNHNLIEKKWQNYWKENKTFTFVNDPKKPKYYVLDMFPYPSGQGLHVGHPKGYTATDIISRYKRLKGFNVLHPIGWDAFGLPAEQYAIDTNNHPKIFTAQNIENFRKQLQSLGFDYDYEQEVNTTDPQYFKWTQWIFSQLFEHGLAEVKETEVNWCEKLATTLANEEVLIDKNGQMVSERGNYPVVKKNMQQWVLKITAYADKLLDGLNDVDWPESLKNLQRNWIGKTNGYKIHLKTSNHQEMDVFITRLDCIYGATFVTINKNHHILKSIKNNQIVNDFIQEWNQKSNRELLSNNEKIGCYIGVDAIHPLTGKKLPIYLTNYAIENEIGANLAIPAHNKNDYKFATQYNLPIINVIENNTLPNEEDGIHVNSYELDHLNNKEATKKAYEILKKQTKIELFTTYKLRDWIFARQRYWGEPFPILYDENNQISLDKNLPLLLPKCNDFKPSKTGLSPLSKIKSFVNVKIDGKQYFRETNTMPQWAGSCWYYLGYLMKQKDGTYLPLNDKKTFALFERWLPIDLYVGGQEHAVLHLLYARFWHRFLYDIKVVPTKEPFYRIINQGMILGEDGQKMSKSKGNTINPNDIIASHGADALRLYEMFMGPLTATLPWSSEGLDGMRKWLDRVYRYFQQLDEKKQKPMKELDVEFLHAYHKFIYAFENNINLQQFNLAISEMMIFINFLYKTEITNNEVLANFLILLSIFAPHLAEELNALLGSKKSICLASFPKYDEKYVVQNKINVPFQINGKNKLILSLDRDLDVDAIESFLNNHDEIKKILHDRVIIKKVIVPNKIINYLVK